MRTMRWRGALELDSCSVRPRSRPSCRGAICQAEEAKNVGRWLHLCTKAISTAGMEDEKEADNCHINCTHADPTQASHESPQTSGTTVNRWRRKFMCSTGALNSTVHRRPWTPRVTRSESRRCRQNKMEREYETGDGEEGKAALCESTLHPRHGPDLMKR